MKMLESLLPSKFEYRFGEVKILEQSEILEEQRFHASFEVNICRKGEAEEFLRCIASKNVTDFKAPIFSKPNWNRFGKVIKKSLPKIPNRTRIGSEKVLKFFRIFFRTELESVWKRTLNKM